MLEQQIRAIYKKRGDTPLQTLQKFREIYPEYKDTILSYAGRLDPMAEGILLILIGEEANKKEQREKQLGLDKTYEVDVLFGFATDTHDTLGLITVSVQENLKEISKEKVEEELKKLVGTFEQEYPIYSSKPVKGKPLFEWAREGKIHEIEIPKKSITIYSAKLVELKKISAERLLANLETDIQKVKGDFRQDETVNLWKKNLIEKTGLQFTLATILFRCGSGTYARVLAYNLGKKIGIPALAYAIKRLQIGTFSLSETILLEEK